MKKFFIIFFISYASITQPMETNSSNNAVAPSMTPEFARFIAHVQQQKKDQEHQKQLHEYIPQFHHAGHAANFSLLDKLMNDQHTSDAVKQKGCTDALALAFSKGFSHTLFVDILFAKYLKYLPNASQFRVDPLLKDHPYVGQTTTRPMRRYIKKKSRLSFPY